MQSTRLNTIVSNASNRVIDFFSNPWRRLALVCISLLSGFFLSTAITSTAGQTADWDVITGGLTVLFTETISRVVYGSRRRKAGEGGVTQTRLLTDMLNSVKIGVTYGMFVEAFKLNS